MTEARFDELIHPSTRLSIAASGRAEFSFIRDRLGLSDSALSTQLSTLEDGGYLHIERLVTDRRRRVRAGLTDQGRLRCGDVPGRRGDRRDQRPDEQEGVDWTGLPLSATPRVRSIDRAAVDLDVRVVAARPEAAQDRRSRGGTLESGRVSHHRQRRWDATLGGVGRQWAAPAAGARWNDELDPLAAALAVPDGSARGVGDGPARAGRQR